MASHTSTTDSITRARKIAVNGVSVLDPTLDEASIILREAHAILCVANFAAKDGELNREIVQNAYAAVERILETGIREMEVGYSDLVRSAH